MAGSKPCRAKNGARLTAEEKAVSRSTFFEVELGQLPVEQRSAVEAAISTRQKTLNLYRRADRAGKPAPGADTRAIRVGSVWLAFRETAHEIQLAQLIPDRAFREIGVRLTPVDGD